MRLADQTTQLSESLQQALLPDLDPAAAAGSTTVTRYQPGEDRLLLGGDLYDLARAPDGSIAFLIGDVAGHGAVPRPSAASLPRRLAGARHDPGRVGPLARRARAPLLQRAAGR